MISPHQQWVAISVAVLLLPMFATGCSGSGFGARTTGVTASIKGQIFDRSHLVDAGNTTPEAALESSFWSESRGDYDADISFFTPKMQEAAKGWYGGKAEYASKTKGRYLRFKSLQIIARKELPDGTVQLRYQFDFNDHRPNQTAGPLEKVVSMVKIDGAWKCAEVTGYTSDWDTGSQPEPQ